MKFVLGSQRTAAAVAAGALVASGAMLVAAPANATVTNSKTLDYTCATALGAQTFKITAFTDVPSSVAAGSRIAPKQTHVDIVIPELLTGALHSVFQAKKVAGYSDDASFTVTTNGKAGAAAPIKGLASPKTTVPASGSMKLRAVGTVAPFKAGSAGDKITLGAPQLFTVTAVDQDDNELPPFPCTLNPGQNATVGTIAVQHRSSTDAKLATKRVTHISRAKVTVKVTADGAAARGKVVAKEGRKTLAKAAVKNGRATLKLAKLAKGKHKVTVTYLGNATTSASKDRLVVKVVK